MKGLRIQFILIAGICIVAAGDSIKSLSSTVEVADIIKALRLSDFNNPEMVRGMNCPDIGNIVESEILVAKEWGANIICTGIDFGTGITQPAINKLPSLLPLVINDLQIFRRHGLKCSIGWRGELFVDQTAKQDPTFWKNPELESTLCNIWKSVAHGLLEYRDVIHGYYLWGEPLDRAKLPYPPSQWRPIAERIVQAIREVDDQTWIIYQPGPGGMPWPRNPVPYETERAKVIKAGLANNK